MTITQSRLERVPLAKLTTGANVRIDLRVTDELVKSIKANGIIQPPVVYPDPDVAGLYRVLTGHRRVAAAGKAGLTDIDVIVRDTPDEPERVVDQLVENVHRDALTVGEQARAYRQLALDFGLPAVQIAKRTATKLDRVGDAITAAGSTAASAILEHAPQLGFDVLARIAEFDDDAAAVKTLSNIAQSRPEQLEHKLHEIRENRRITAELAALKTMVDEANVTVGVSDALGYLMMPWRALQDYVHPDDIETRLPRSVENLDDLPDGVGVGVVVTKAWDQAHGRYIGTLKLVLDTTADHGLVEYWKARNHAQSAQDDADAQATEAERARRIAEREAYEAAAASARTVRRAWLTELLAKPTLPDTALEYAAVQVIAGTWLATEETEDLTDSQALALTLLGIDIPEEPDPDLDYDPLPRKEALFLTAERDHRPTHALLALVLAERETETAKGFRRGDRDIVRYFEVLESWGYGLSDHERDAITPAPAETTEEQDA